MSVLTNQAAAAAEVTTEKRPKVPRPPKKMKSFYPSWFYIPAAALFIVFFAVPTFASF